MNIILINGSKNENGTTKRALEEARATLEKQGDTVRIYHIKNYSVPSCTGCGGCKRSGKCVIGDLDEISKDLFWADGIIIAAPTHYACAPGALVSLLSRIFMSSVKAVRNKPAAIIAVGRRGCLNTVINEISSFFAFSSSPIANGIYPAIYYGDGDNEGLQNIRSIASNLHWLTEAINYAKENGITAPTEEERIKTDIRTLTKESPPLP